MAVCVCARECVRVVSNFELVRISVRCFHPKLAGNDNEPARRYHAPRMAEERLAAASSMLSDPELPPADVPTTPVGGSDTRFRTEPTLGLLESVRQVRGWVREDMQMLSPYAMEAKQLLSSKGKELLGAATQASAAASQTLKATAAEAGLDWRAYLGGDDGGAALCGACAAPFSHGAALAPELRRFQQHFDRTAEDVAALRLASDQVRVRARARARVRVS